MKLYPPYIEGTIPAFYSTSKGTVLTVPFSMNKAVSKSSITGFQLKLKTVQNNTYLITATSTDWDADSEFYVKFDLTSSASKLNIGQFYKIQIAYISNSSVGYFSTVGITKYTTKPEVKIKDLVYGNINMHTYNYIGTYSQASYTYEIADVNETNYEPDTYYITSEDSEKELCERSFYLKDTYYNRVLDLNPSSDNYKDSTEKEYKYRFLITNKNNAIVVDSGWLLHNNSNDENSYESYDDWSYNSDIDKNSSYYLTYQVLTTNNMEISSPRYRIMQKSSISPEIELTFSATMNKDNGYVLLSLYGPEEDEVEKSVTGSFIISRACSDTNYKAWEEIDRFSLRGSRPSKHSFKDFTIEQGKYYKYCIQQYNSSGVFSERIKTSTIFADFEDMYLFDGEKQLKIAFNPKVTSFKMDLLETKTDTIGSKFPFIFKNGVVNYKEFPLSGLISYYMDDENLFMTEDDLGLTIDTDSIERPVTFSDDINDENFDEFFENVSSNADASMSDSLSEMSAGYSTRKQQITQLEDGRHKTTSLTGQNFAAERIFKLKVLEWLNNGKPKLFRSPAEGNYIVRLMNISFAPTNTDSLSRMLHTFSATAYEIAEYNYDNLCDYDIIVPGIVNTSDIVLQEMQWRTLPLDTTDSSYEGNSRYIQNGSIYYANGEMVENGSTVHSLRLEDMTPGSKIKLGFEDGSLTTIVIGTTGTYKIDDISVAITSIVIPDGSYYTGILTYGYYINTVIDFNIIKNISIEEVPCHTYYGDQTKLITRVVDNDYDEDDYLSVETETSLSSYGIKDHILISALSNNIVQQIEDSKQEIDSFYYMKFELRETEDCYDIVPEDMVTYDDYNVSTLTNSQIYFLYEFITQDDTYTYNFDTKTIMCDGIDVTEEAKEYVKENYNEYLQSLEGEYGEALKEEYANSHSSGIFVVNEQTLYVELEELRAKKLAGSITTEEYRTELQNLLYIYSYQIEVDYEEEDDYYLKKTQRTFPTFDMKISEDNVIIYDADSDVSETAKKAEYVYYYVQAEDLNYRDFYIGNYYTKSTEKGKDYYTEAETYKENETYYYRQNTYSYVDPLNDKTYYPKDEYDFLVDYLTQRGIELSSKYGLYDTTVIIDGNIIDLSEIGSYEIKNPIEIKSLIIGSGVMATLGYNILTKTYVFESKNTYTDFTTAQTNYLYYKNILTPAYMKASCLPTTTEIVDDIVTYPKDEAYIEKLEDARENYTTAYETYEDLVDIYKALAEEEASVL